MKPFTQLTGTAAPLPIAGGETLTRRQAFQPWLEAGAFDIVQPDVAVFGRKDLQQAALVKALVRFRPIPLRVRIDGGQLPHLADRHGDRRPRHHPQRLEILRLPRAQRPLVVCVLAHGAGAHAHHALVAGHVHEGGASGVIGTNSVGSDSRGIAVDKQGASGVPETMEAYGMQGTPTLLGTNTTGFGLFQPSVTPDGAGWAVAWVDVEQARSEVRRAAARGPKTDVRRRPAAEQGTGAPGGGPPYASGTSVASSPSSAPRRTSSGPGSGTVRDARSGSWRRWRPGCGSPAWP